MTARHVVIALLLGALSVRSIAEETLLERLDVDTHGFVDARGGLRTSNDPYQRQTSLAEIRLQLEATATRDTATMQLRADLLYDDVADDHDIALESGQGWLDLREAYLLLYPTDVFDLKIGRQILTWGTGDLLFINDMFPKDWRSFFAGRDEEYLKAPSDAVLLSVFPGSLTVDLAYTPRFDPDRFISGERISYWNTMLGRRAGRDAVVEADVPDQWFEDDELAARVSGTLAGMELAVYAYDGFWKSPGGYDPQAMLATFPRLSVFGAGVRGTLAGGIASAEAGRYLSPDDRAGDDPMTPNGETRVMAQYERELKRNLMASVQIYLEHMLDYGAYRATLAEDAPPADEDRTVVTLRLTRLAVNQNLTVSLFTYYSPSDRDTYLRPIVKYKLTDDWLLTAGGNFFAGREPYTFFGQFEDNSNLYAGARYSF